VKLTAGLIRFNSIQNVILKEVLCKFCQRSSQLALLFLVVFFVSAVGRSNKNDYLYALMDTRNQL